MGGVGSCIAEDGSRRLHIQVLVTTVERNMDRVDDGTATSNVGTFATSASNSAPLATLDSRGGCQSHFGGSGENPDATLLMLMYIKEKQLVCQEEREEGRLEKDERAEDRRTMVQMIGAIAGCYFGRVAQTEVKVQVK